MHGTTNSKFIDSQQAKLAYQYKNTKRKLYKTNAAIWYNIPAYLRPYTAYVLLIMGGIVTRNMQSKAIEKNKRNCCILLDLFHYQGHYQYRPPPQEAIPSWGAHPRFPLSG